MIHKYKNNGFNIVLDVNSGGVHIVDDITYDLLDNVEPPFDSECPAEVIKKLERSYSREEVGTATLKLLSYTMTEFFFR